MGWYFRKSVRFGPARLNFSKSGVGVSVGVPGARVTAGPRGTYVTLGRGGIYYRHRLDTPKARTHYLPAAPEAPLPAFSPAKHEIGLIATADVQDLVDTNADDTLARINGEVGRRALAPWSIGACLALVFLVGSAAPGAGGTVLLLTPVVWLFVRWWDKQRRTVFLHYTLEENFGERVALARRACEALGRSHKLWRVRTHQHTSDWKRNAGANGLVTRKVVSAGIVTPPLIKTNIEVPGIALDDSRLLFFPDRLLVWQGGRYGAVSYDALYAQAGVSRFIEEEAVPWDATVVDQTWRFVNKSGGPDRRFNNNRQLPVCAYGRLDLSSPSGLHIVLDTSSGERALESADALDQLGRWGLATVTEVAPVKQARRKPIAKSNVDSFSASN